MKNVNFDQVKFDQVIICPFFAKQYFQPKKKESLFIRLNAKQEQVVTKERRVGDQSQLFSSFPFLQIIQWSAGQVHINIKIVSTSAYSAFYQKCHDNSESCHKKKKNYEPIKKR